MLESVLAVRCDHTRARAAVLTPLSGGLSASPARSEAWGNDSSVAADGLVLLSCPLVLNATNTERSC